MGAIRGARFVMLALVCTTALAASEVGVGLTKVRELVLQEAQEMAKQWAIEPVDWVRYRELMAGPRGAWSPNADPLTVLGAGARNDAERRRFADAFVVMEFERVRAELEFQREVNRAWQRNFPGRLRLANMKTGKKRSKGKPSQLAQYANIQRYALVLESDCAGCLAVVDQYVSLAKSSQLNDFAVDIYIRKTNQDDNRLRRWVAANQIPVELIRDSKLTVNHGDKYAQGAVPQVWARLGNGEWVLQQ